MTARPALSVVIPCFDEEETLPRLVERLTPALEEAAVTDYEVIFVDDGSADGTPRILDSLASEETWARVLHLSRNFGHQAALSAGLDAAGGDAVVLMDGDLQDPPELLPRLVAEWRDGWEVVYAVRSSRRESLPKRIFYALYYRSLKALAEIDPPLDSGDFCLMDRRVVEVLIRLPERNRFLRGLRAWAGFRQTGVEYDREARVEGESKYSLGSLVELALSGYVGFSVAPLRAAGVLGLAGAALGLFLGAFTVTLKFTDVYAPPGWTSTFAMILFLGGGQLLVLGIIGEYLGRVYDEVRRRPLYVIRERRGFDDRSDGSEA